MTPVFQGSCRYTFYLLYTAAETHIYCGHCYKSNLPLLPSSHLFNFGHQPGKVRDFSDGSKFGVKGAHRLIGKSVGINVEEVMDEYGIEREDVLAAIEYATNIVAKEEIKIKLKYDFS